MALHALQWRRAGRCGRRAGGGDVALAGPDRIAADAAGCADGFLSLSAGSGSLPEKAIGMRFSEAHAGPGQIRISRARKAAT